MIEFENWIGTAHEDGTVCVDNIVDYFIGFCEARKRQGQVVERSNSIFCKGNYIRKEVERNIFSNPFKRFEDMRFMNRCRDVEYMEFNNYIWKILSEKEKVWIMYWCEIFLNTLVWDYKVYNFIACFFNF